MNPLLILFILLITLPLQGIAGNRLQPFTAEFDLFRGSIKLGRTTISLEVKGDRYHYHSRTRPSGIASLIRSDTINESSRGQILANGNLQPQTYRYLHKKGKTTERDMRISFDAKTSRAKHLLNDKRPWQLETPANTQDKMSAQLALMQGALAGQKAVIFPVAGGGKLRHYRYQLEKSENIDTTLGHLKTHRYRRLIKNDSVKLVLWLSPEHNQLPVRIERSDKDSDGVYRLRLTGLTLNGRKLDTGKGRKQSDPDVMVWGE